MGKLHLKWGDSVLFVVWLVVFCKRMLNRRIVFIVNPLSANITKWSNTLKQFVGKLPMNCLSVFNHFVGLAFKGLKHGNCSCFLKCSYIYHRKHLS